MHRRGRRSVDAQHLEFRTLFVPALPNGLGLDPWEPAVAHATNGGDAIGFGGGLSANGVDARCHRSDRLLGSGRGDGRNDFFGV